MSDLLQALYKAHAEVAIRGNPSHQALILAAQGSRNYFNALTAAFATYGGLHGPLGATYDLLVRDDPCHEIQIRLEVGLKIPGYGNSFYKDGIEPAFLPVEEELRKVNPVLAGKIDLMTEFIHGMGKKIYPNPSTFTCAVALVEGVPKEAVGFLVVQARLLVWTKEFVRVVGETPEI